MFKSVTFSLVLSVLCSAGCAISTEQNITILISDTASVIDRSTAEDLKADFKLIGIGDVQIEVWNPEHLLSNSTIVVGTIGQHSLIDKLADQGQLTLSAATPGARGGVWAKINVQDTTIAVLAGSDAQGTQYAVYDYSREILNIDPLWYWTGIKPPKNPDLDFFAFKPRTIPPPRVPYLVYFENDVDELANMKKPYLEYDWENYTQLINALVRLRYNGIEFFDMLGREEFYKRASYRKIRPDYEINTPLLERMIDYAHDKGMYVQIDMMMGRPFQAITMEESNCWTRHKQRWLDTWSYYLTETPIKKADIFTLRPRNQVLDWPYTSSCDEDRVEVFNQVYAALGKLLDQYKPQAVKVCVCYDDGMELYNEGFNPPEDFIIAWSDDGWGGFRILPEDTRGFRFGTYMHAGFWLNHDVHDPYPEKIEHVMTDMFNRFNADQYLMVNGQTFRPFLINLEAFSRVANQPEKFNGMDFYQEWVTRYFDETLVEDTIEALTSLHAAQFDNVGYVQHLWEIKTLVAYLTDQPIERPDKTPIPVSFSDIEPQIAAVQKRSQLLADAATAAERALASTEDPSHFYHDHIYLPILLYQDLLHYDRVLQELALLKHAYAQDGDLQHLEQAKPLLETAKQRLAQLHQRRQTGDKNPDWKGWYLPEKRRPNNGFPNVADLAAIEAHASSNWNH